MLAPVMRRSSFVLLMLVVAACAYPRRTTHMHEAPVGAVNLDDRPKGMWTFRLLSGQLPLRKHSGLKWDSDGSGPDPFVRIYVDDRLIWESDTIENQIKPNWNVTLPHNVIIRSDVKFRLVDQHLNRRWLQSEFVRAL